MRLAKKTAIIMESIKARVFNASDFIYLTQSETRLFQELKRVVSITGCQTTLRVAGGWVRDKLLNQSSEDIDITLDNMMGQQFAQLIKAHSQNASGTGVIRANPDASKHLQTACLKVMGTWIDLVNLRAQDYSEESRIPTMKIGSPQQDAFRRDLTINSMFYNIMSHQIQDLTGLGIEDLNQKIARTPLEPHQTFIDDPLRVLRTIRFASRFQLSISEDIFVSSQHPSIVESLNSKVSRERIGKEFSLMMKGNNPLQALRLIHDFHLLPTVFQLPAGCQDILEKGFQIAIECSAFRSPLENFYLYTSAVLSPYIGGGYTTVFFKKKMQVYSYVCLHSLKTSNAEEKAISTILSCLPAAVEALGCIENWKVGEIIRNTRENWPICFQLARVWGNFGYQQFQLLELFVSENQLSEFYNEKPLVNGAELKKLFGLQGPNIANGLQLCFEWQARNRQGTKEELIEFLREVLNR